MNRFAHAIYCDDVRLEAGNKQSLMGVYHSKMLVQGFPYVAPKLCVAVWAITPPEKPFKALTLRLLFGDNVLVEHSLPIEYAADPKAEDPMRIMTAFAVLQIAPFKADAPNTLRLRVVTEEEELKAGGLDIELAAAPAQAAGPQVERQA
jgi:hypothetical protein